MIEYEESQRKAGILMEALPYVRRFRGSVFVVKYGGSFMDSPDPEVRAQVARDLVFLHFVGIKVVVVHGGGKAVTKELEKRGLQAQFIDGLRKTDEQSIAVVDEILNEKVNAEVADYVSSFDCKVRRFAGKDIIRCIKLEKVPDLGFVGSVQKVDNQSITNALDDGLMPIISSTGSDDHGQCYNVNADTVAAEVAKSLKARRLVYLHDVPGLLSDPNDNDSLVSSLAVDQVDSFKDNGVISQGCFLKSTVRLKP